MNQQHGNVSVNFGVTAHGALNGPVQNNPFAHGSIQINHAPTVGGSVAAARGHADQLRNELRKLAGEHVVGAFPALDDLARLTAHLDVPAVDGAALRAAFELLLKSCGEVDANLSALAPLRETVQEIAGG